MLRYVFWADERCVDLNDTDSSYASCKQYLFDQKFVTIPESNIFTILPGAKDLSNEVLVKDYEEKMQIVKGKRNLF